MESTASKSEAKSLAHDPRQFHKELLQLVGFHVGGEEFGIDILRVQEIIRAQQLTRVPNSPDCMEGVMNLREKSYPSSHSANVLVSKKLLRTNRTVSSWSRSRARCSGSS